MRRIVRAVGWVGLLGVVTIFAVIGAVGLTHPRDEAGYLRYVQLFPRSYDGMHGPNVSSAELIDAGGQACSWLAHQQPGLWRTHPPYRESDLLARYTHGMNESDRSLPLSVVPGAWHYLCPATTLLVKSHFVFSHPSD